MFKKLLVLVLCASLTLCWAGPSQAMMTLDEERTLGDEAYQEIMAAIPIITDPDVVDYVRGVGKKLSAHVENSPFEFTFNVADEGTLNAFAIPGGYIFVFRGMITSLDSEAELAGIMGHEMGHVWRRHIAKRMDKATPLTVASLAGMIAGALLGVAAGVPQLGQAIAMGSMAGGIQGMLAFSREDEEEADWAGFNTMTDAGYPGMAMEQSFRRIWRMERHMGSTEVPTYLRTHPTSPARMEHIENMVRHSGKGKGNFDNSEFLRIKMRLLALYEPENQAEEELNRLRVEHPDDPTVLYGLALYRMRRDDYKAAVKYLEAVAKKWPRRSYILRDQGISYMLMGDYGKAQDLLGQALLLQPDDREALLYLGRSYLAGNYLDPARHAFSQLVEKDPEFPEAQHFLGLAYGKQGKEGLASYHLGLAFELKGSYKSAEFHLQKALDDPELPQKYRDNATKILEDLRNHPGQKPPLPPPPSRDEEELDRIRRRQEDRDREKKKTGFRGPTFTFQMERDDIFGRSEPMSRSVLGPDEEESREGETLGGSPAWRPWK